MIRGILIIFSFLIAGELLQQLLSLIVPGNILGMILIFIALKVKLFPLEWVKPVADKLLFWLPLFFIPYAVGLMQFTDLLATHGTIILLITLIASTLTLIVTAWLQQKLDRTDGKNH